jgi:hypothetical protein
MIGMILYTNVPHPAFNFRAPPANQVQNRVNPAPNLSRAARLRPPIANQPIRSARNPLARTLPPPYTAFSDERSRARKHH